MKPGDDNEDITFVYRNGEHHLYGEPDKEILVYRKGDAIDIETEIWVKY